MSRLRVLEGRASHFRQLVLDVAIGPGGMIIDGTGFETRRPYQEGEDHGAFSELYGNDLEWGQLSPKPTVAEIMYGEDNLFTTGWFLWSQLLRYEATGEDEAIATARKCFRDVNNIFRLSAAIEPGILGKPHGGRGGGTMSYDQSACPIVPYGRFALDHATVEEREAAARNLLAHGDYYLRHDLGYVFCGHRHSFRDMRHPSAMKTLAAMHAAATVSGDQRVLAVVEEQLEKLAASGAVPWPSPEYETNHNLFYWAFLCDYWLGTEHADLFDWRGCIQAYWSVAKRCFGDDDLVLAALYDVARDEIELCPEGWFGLEESMRWQPDPARTAESYYLSPTLFAGRTVRSGYFASLALLARSHGLDAAAHEQAERTLAAIEEDHLRWWQPDERLPDSYRAYTECFQAQAAAMWLGAYWSGRLQGLWV